MFILVKYGNNETLLCNPSCAVINLLHSIKSRAGYGKTNVTVDLSDDTGLVKELDAHKYDYANKHLASHATYVLVQKEITRERENSDTDSTPTPIQYNYKPLLEKYEEVFPNFQIRSAEVLKPLKVKARGGKSPSPAGRYTTKPAGKKATTGRPSGRRK